MNLLITGAWQSTDAQRNELKALGHVVEYLPWESEPLPCAPNWVEGVVCNSFFQYHPIESFPNLKFIQLTTAGMDQLPLDYIQKHRIELRNAKGVYSVPMAEFALGGVLQLYKHSRALRENQIQHKWEKYRDLRELSGKTVLILGCGEVGKECAKRFQAFGCKVVGLNRTTRENKYFTEIHFLDELDAHLPTADILLLSIALTEQTKHILGKTRFARLKPDAVLVNLSRGALVDTEALILWLQTNQNTAAVLDVFEQEPLPTDSPLWDMDNVILTPHNSFAGEGNSERLYKVITGNLNGTKG